MRFDSSFLTADGWSFSSGDIRHICGQDFFHPIPLTLLIPSIHRLPLLIDTSDYTRPPRFTPSPKVAQYHPSTSLPSLKSIANELAKSWYPLVDKDIILDEDALPWWCQPPVSRSPQISKSEQWTGLIHVKVPKAASTTNLVYRAATGPPSRSTQ